MARVTAVPTDEVLLIEDRGPVRILTMNRPEEMNAADAVLHRRLAEVWAETAERSDTHVVVLTGAGRAFSAGGNLPRMVETQRDPRVQDEVFDEARRTVTGMIGLPQPIVAAVNGPAVGLGASLVALCDLSVMAESAFLADPHLTVGLVPGDGAAFLWSLSAGLARAKEYVLLGQRISAQTALEAGLVNRVVPRDAVLDTALEIAERLAELPQRALRDTRRILNNPAAQAMGQCLELALATERQSLTSTEHASRVEDLVARSSSAARGSS